MDKEIEVRSLAEYVEAVIYLNKGSIKGSFYRGLSKNYPLETTLQRKVRDLAPHFGPAKKNSQKKAIEQILHTTNKFKQGYISYYNNNSIKADIDILALAQHFGMPTPLLDWSLSPVVALYFAIGKLSYEQTLSFDEIVNFNKETVNDQRNIIQENTSILEENEKKVSKGFNRVIKPYITMKRFLTTVPTKNAKHYAPSDNPVVHVITPDIANIDFKYSYELEDISLENLILGETESYINKDRLLIITPKNICDRLNLQQGVFSMTHPHNNEFPVQTCKIIINKYFAAEIYSQLITMGIADKNIYGDLPSYADELNFSFTKLIKEAK